jgi:sirohydrochlorin cobaltochelatase
MNSQLCKYRARILGYEEDGAPQVGRHHHVRSIGGAGHHHHHH